MVFKQQNFGMLDDALRPYVTEWANDPIWDSPAADLTPSAANFIHTTQGPLAVKLAEIDETVKVVGYPVEYDADRGLWFADVDFAYLNSYTPMMRLALARFQPESVGNCFISRVVRTDFIQPLPDRTLVIRRNKSGLPQLTVTLTGLAPTLAAGWIRPVRAWIEKLAEPDKGDFGWQPLGEDVVGLKPSANPSALWAGTFSFKVLCCRAPRSAWSSRRRRPSYPAMLVCGRYDPGSADAADCKPDRVRRYVGDLIGKPIVSVMNTPAGKRLAAQLKEEVVLRGGGEVAAFARSCVAEQHGAESGQVAGLGRSQTVHVRASWPDLDLQPAAPPARPTPSAAGGAAGTRKLGGDQM